MAAARQGGTPAPAGPVPAGSHVFPMVGPTTYSDDWLAPRGGGRLHVGIDLFAPHGTPLVAATDGVLRRVGQSGISGLRLWLDGNDGYGYFYAHLSGFSPAAREGASVRAGQVIGYNGATGDAVGTSPHLHFEIHPDGGGPIRPYPIVSAWPRVGGG
jgi:murein DD-endopeptidase MepM/ murein hydrolase activator NlpD